jgi:hypothetical protein
MWDYDNTIGGYTSDFFSLALASLTTDVAFWKPCLKDV